MHATDASLEGSSNISTPCCRWRRGVKGVIGGGTGPCKLPCQRARSPSHRAAPSCQCAAVCRPHVRFCTCSFRGSLETDRGEIGSMPHIDLVRRFHGWLLEALLKSRIGRTDGCSMGTNLLLHGMRVASLNDLKSYRLAEADLQPMATDGAGVIRHERTIMFFNVLVHGTKTMDRLKSKPCPTNPPLIRTICNRCWQASLKRASRAQRK